jgi:DNA-binding response OmpR family regulator
MKILIADDKKELGELVRDFLVKKGHNADIALDGRVAWELMKKNIYDLAFIDHNMPELTGLELVKLVKENKLKTKTVILTGYPSMKDFFAKSIGADEYISKPCHLEDIERIVEKYSEDNVRVDNVIPKKILLVDDEVNIVKLLKTRLEANSYKVITASNGEEAVQKFVSEKADLVILDITMPKMDGYTTLTAIREMEAGRKQGKRVPVIMLSARLNDSRVKKLAEEREIEAYLSKPFSADELLSKIREIFNVS